MPEFKIVDNKRYPLKIQVKKDNLNYYRFEHRATIHFGARIFFVIADNGIIYGNNILEGPQVFIEEITDGSLKAIEDDKLHEALSKFAQDKNLCLMLPPLFKDTYVI